MAEPGADEPIHLEPGISLFICRLLDGSGGVEGSNLVGSRISLFICHSHPTRGCAGGGGVILFRDFFIYLSIHPMAEPGGDEPIRLEPGISLFICRLFDGSGGVEGSNLVGSMISLFIYRSVEMLFGLSTGRTFECMISLLIYSSTWARREAASEIVIVCAGSSADLRDRVGDSPCLRNIKDFLWKLKPGRPDWLPAP